MKNLTRQETIERMCGLITKVGVDIFNNTHTHDCFCEDEYACISEDIVKYIEHCIDEKIDSGRGY